MFALSELFYMSVTTKEQTNTLAYFGCGSVVLWSHFTVLDSEDSEWLNYSGAPVLTTLRPPPFPFPLPDTSAHETTTPIQRMSGECKMMKVSPLALFPPRC